jgi:hypothetical protein
VPVRSRSGTGVHVPAERKRALAVHSVSAVEAVPDGELPGSDAATVVQDRGEGTSLGGRLVEPGGCCGGVLHRVVGDRDGRRPDTGELVTERLGRVVLGCAPAQAVPAVIPSVMTVNAATVPSLIARMSALPSQLMEPVSPPIRRVFTV